MHGLAESPSNGTGRGDGALEGTAAVAAWLVEHRGRTLDHGELFQSLCERLVAAGIPLLRVSGGLPALHPQLFARGLSWTRGTDVVETARDHNTRNLALYRDSPVALIHEGSRGLRRRLVPGMPLDFPVLADVMALGATDYVILPLRFTHGWLSFMSWTTDRPSGFTDAELAELEGLMPLIALRFEICAAHLMAQDLLTTYLGHDAGERILSGTIMRGQGETVDAAIWYSDLRGFTAMAEKMRPRDLITTLDDYFECLARPVHEAGGEIMKFIGDGMLAIFRVGDGPDARATACDRALDAAKGALDALHVLNQGRALGGGAPLRTGIALHLGQVIYGNIGSADRLDFTVIGRAVNVVSRLEAQTKVLNRQILVTAGVAAEVKRHRLDALGTHVLRGIQDPYDLYGVPEDELAG